jgi:hypothetical protein
MQKYDKAGRSPPRRVKNLSALNDVDDLAATLCAELNRACDESEERVVATTADAGTGVEVGSALADDDFAGLDLKGKYAVVLSGAPDGMNSEVAAHLARTSKGIAALQAGAVGLITVRTLKEAARLPWEKFAPRARLPRRVLLGPDGQALGDGAGLKVRASIDDAAAAAIFAGSAMSFADVQTRLSTAIWSELRDGKTSSREVDSLRRNLQREHIKQADLRFGRNPKRHHCTTAKVHGSVLMWDTVTLSPGARPRSSVAAWSSHSHSAAQ